jgi:hypothetical protein
MSKFLDYVDQGRLGGNEGLYNCFDSFNDYLCNTQRGTYYAVGGMPGSGKSAFVDDNFILSPYMFYKKRDGKVKVKWFYYSFEISYMAKRAKWTAYKLFTDYGLTVDSSFILSKGSKNRISQEVYDKVVEVDQYMDELFDHITFIQDPENPTGVRNTVAKFAEQNGTVHTENYTHPDGSIGKRRTGYTPKDPELYVQVIVDHVGLTKKERGYDTKQNIDKLSEYMIEIRNMYNYTPILVCQFNKGLSGIERLKLAHSGKVDLAPILEDFKDTGNIGQDCNVALGVFNPVKFDLQEYAGYDITKMPNSFRSIHLMKNRDGQEYVVKAMHFAGGRGKLVELPRPQNFQLGLQSYNDYQ